MAQLKSIFVFLIELYRIKIACAPINCFFTRKISDIEDSKEIAQEMKNKVYEKNDPEKYLKKNQGRILKK